MYQITKLSPESQSFIRTLATNGTSRSAVSSLALGRVISDVFDLPSAPVDSPVDHWRTHHVIQLRTWLSTLNEIILLDTDAVQSYALAWYQYRYQAAYPLPVVAALVRSRSILDLFGISKHFSATDISTLESEHLRLTDYANQYRNVIRDLKLLDPYDLTSAVEG